MTTIEWFMLSMACAVLVLGVGLLAAAVFLFSSMRQTADEIMEIMNLSRTYCHHAEAAAARTEMFLRNTTPKATPKAPGTYESWKP